MTKRKPDGLALLALYLIVAPIYWVALQCERLSAKPKLMARIFTYVLGASFALLAIGITVIGYAKAYLLLSAAP